MSSSGSSPRMRGTHGPPDGTQTTMTVHPRACGELHQISPHHPRRTVHPRACGELVLNDDNNPADYGSSPRMRGTRRRTRIDRDGSRFIPAHAGNSQDQAVPPARPPVHPRACGELMIVRRLTTENSGSSPRMRGTLWQRGWSSVLGIIEIGSAADRFIPAHAGNSMPMRQKWPEKPVHPRACGERKELPRPLARNAGSSPRMRGTRRYRSALSR